MITPLPQPLSPSTMTILIQLQILYELALSWPTTSTTAATIGTSSTSDDTTAIDGTNTIHTTDTAISTTTKKRRGRPQLLKEIPENCYVCRVTETPYFRKGTDEGVVVDLCNACGLYYMKLEKIIVPIMF
ncbi:hypothetical protein ACTFIW_002795 [Dictyostelium discoideum]